MQITDAQIHLWQGENSPPHHWRGPFTIERALQEMEEAGIARAVNCPAIWDANANDYAVKAAQQYPQRFATLGWFPLDEHANEALVDEWLDKPGMLGLRFVIATPELGAQVAARKLDWLWDAANRREMPMGVFIVPQFLPAFKGIAIRFPRMRLLIDHLSIIPFAKLPDAAVHLDSLLKLANHPNISVKATGIPSMATDGYPFASTRDVLRRTFDAFGSDRMFWGTDITRLHGSWGECVTMFVDDLPWLKGRDLERVMGAGISDWIGWR
ncbi:MAG: hypothetical protein CBARDCOR_6164 [uncultured Caballeronia sp.]|nr:MAG: hypothetical protein CBARDCOR_6164 [uncultured Caballeronia sp.]